MNSQIGKILILAGLTIISLGIILLIAGKTGLFKLPGDIHIKGKNFSFYFPIVSCIIISAILTLIFWLIKFLR